jgi:organic hydroperoxide reductase OsmC/OhrA
MASMSVSLRNVPGTRAAMGWAGGHTVVIDRPEGRAGGMGLGFNGGQMIALAIGGCFCNDLRYVADAMGVDLDTVEVDVAIELAGTPLLVTSAILTARVTAGPGVDVAEIIRRAKADSTVSNSVSAGFPVTILTA